MPSIESRTVPLNTDKYERVDPPAQAPPTMDISQDSAPGLNPTLRSVLPPFYASTDNLRQFYVNSRIPQYRVLPTAPLKTS